MWYPYKRQVALQTPLLREGVRALRQALSAAYRGHPSFAVPVTLQIPTGRAVSFIMELPAVRKASIIVSSLGHDTCRTPHASFHMRVLPSMLFLRQTPPTMILAGSLQCTADMYEALPPLAPDPTGGFLPLLRLHASLALPGYYQGPIAENARLSAALSALTPAEVIETCGYVYGARLRVSALHRDARRPASVVLIPALRALRFNTMFHGLDLSGLGEGSDGENEVAALAELLMYNVTLQEVRGQMDMDRCVRKGEVDTYTRML